METQTFSRKTTLPTNALEAFAWHARPGAFQRLSPPWQTVKVIDQRGGVRNGDTLTIGMKMGPITKQWHAEHFDYIEGEQFCDRQVRGPFAFWEHQHKVTPIDDETCELEDRIEYRLPMGAAGRLLGGRHAKQELNRLFNYRHHRTRQDLAMHNRYQTTDKLTVAITGASGLVGSALAGMLTTGGHRVIRLVRSKPTSAGKMLWKPNEGVESTALVGVDAVVHLAGENLAKGRWTDEKIAAIRDSRVIGTRKLCESLAAMQKPPKVLINASAIGFYGNRGEETLDETSAVGKGILAEIVNDWEQATTPASDAGIRVCLARIGVVLSPTGGALKKMLTPFRMGAGGPIGNGKQMFSWVDLNDVIGAILHMIMTPDLAGPVNITSPNAVTNRAFSKTLGRVLRRPAIAPLPAPIAKLAFGKMAEELLLSSANVKPARLAESGYHFIEPDLETALRRMLGKTITKQSA